MDIIFENLRLASRGNGFIPKNQDFIYTYKYLDYFQSFNKLPNLCNKGVFASID